MEGLSSKYYTTCGGAGCCISRRVMQQIQLCSSTPHDGWGRGRDLEFRVWAGFTISTLEPETLPSSSTRHTRMQEKHQARPSQGGLIPVMMVHTAGPSQGACIQCSHCSITRDRGATDDDSEATIPAQAGAAVAKSDACRVRRVVHPRKSHVRCRTAGFISTATSALLSRFIAQAVQHSTAQHSTAPTNVL
jgi:hypothetical protein